MATYWLSDAGNDGNNGTSYALAKATPAAALALLTAKGDILNIVGDVLLDTTAYVINGDGLGNAGTSYSDPAFIIRGTDSSGVAAEATLTADATHYAFLTLDDKPNYGIIRGIHFDMAASPSVSNIRLVYCIGAGHFPLRIQYCRASRSTIAVNSRQPRLVYAVATYDAGQVSGQPEVLVEYRYLDRINIYGDNGHTVRADHVIYYDSIPAYYGNGPLVNQETYAGVRWPGAKMTNCTIDIKHQNAVAGGETQFGLMIDYVNDSATDNTDRLCHSNLLVFAASATLNLGQLFNSGLITSSNVNSAGTFSGTVGYNHLVFDTNFFNSIDGNAAVDFYAQHYNPDQPTTVDGTALHTGDLRLDNTTLADVIADAASTYLWEDIESSGYDILLPKDYRLDLASAAVGGLGGSYVGALDAANQAPTGQNQSYSTEESVSLQVSAVSGLLVGATDPNVGDTLSLTNVGTPTNGILTSYNTTTGSFVYTPNAFFAGSDSFTFKIWDGTIASVATYTASITITALAPPDQDDEAVYVDTAPFFKPTLRVATEFRIRTKKNRRKHIDLANYTEDREWNESTHRVITLATNTTSQVTLGGVATAQYLIVETDAAIDVSINDTVRKWTVEKSVAVALGTITKLYITNDSTTTEAQVIMTVSD